MGDASVKSFAIGVALATAALALAPTAQADMQVGNYRLDTNRDPGHSWIWAISPCISKAPGCLTIQGIPQPNGQAAPWKADAHLSNGQYTMTVDVPDGVRCVVQFFPSHDVYTWDQLSLGGQVVSTYDTGCGGGPGGTNTYPFSLVRW
ncbi:MULTISPECIES: hypothetical protein [unclassified Mycobacterium]|uniref:hypothetical protein n=1 Tax=unclassified Mycobacterium TaxID=2642494 RepID=UPI00096D665A|nr:MULTISPECIES: hypothetical protein [unclassified Mycobacterium]OMC17288.1 hypothetical protein A5736_16585 [Mycobacterium sp. SP-6446]OMC56743.1 hypothetical protein A5747_05690 [Mycobacterium sp. IS-836]